MSNKTCWGRGRGQLFRKCWIITKKTPPKKKGDSFSFEKWELRKWHFVASLSFYSWTLVPRSTQLSHLHHSVPVGFWFFFFPTFILVHSQIWLIYFLDYSMRESLNVITLVNSIKNSPFILLTHMESTVCGPLQTPWSEFHASVCHLYVHTI
jgi:hypothetical protein